ncbi:MAG: hypothetical protein ABIS08_00170 [Pseudolysinimonas sp.]
MSSERWSDRDLRAFVMRAPRLSWGDSELAEVERRAFRAQLVAIAASGIQTRILAEVGSLTSLEGLAVLSCELLEDGDYVDSKKRAWLLVCAEPWQYLEQWVTESVVHNYRATIGRRTKDLKVLSGIVAASSRDAIEGGQGE